MREEIYGGQTNGEPQCGVAPSELTGQGGKTSYRGWWIEYDPPPIPTRNCDWQFWHDDFDGAPDSLDGRCGSAPTEAAAKEEIDAWEDDNGH